MRENTYNRSCFNCFSSPSSTGCVLSLKIKNKHKKIVKTRKYEYENVAVNPKKTSSLCERCRVYRVTYKLTQNKMGCILTVRSKSNGFNSPYLHKPILPWTPIPGVN